MGGECGILYTAHSSLIGVALNEDAEKVGGVVAT
jgi:hypothetical protein